MKEKPDNSRWARLTIFVTAILLTIQVVFGLVDYFHPGIGAVNKVHKHLGESVFILSLLAFVLVMVAKTFSREVKAGSLGVFLGVAVQWLLGYLTANTSFSASGAHMIIGLAVVGLAHWVFGKSKADAAQTQIEAAE